MIYLTAFWETFDYSSNLITYLVKKHNLQFTKDVLFVGSFIEKHNIQSIINFNGIKILYLTEPLFELYPITYLMYIGGHFDMTFGSIDDNKTNNSIKFTYYIHRTMANGEESKVNNPSEIDKNLFNSINKKVMHENLVSKKFCTMICRHDMGKTRTCAYDVLAIYDKIDCPSVFKNNC